MTPEQIFAIKYDRLEEILTGQRVSDLVDLSAILRLMLVDRLRLMDLANRTHGLKIRFEVGPATEDDMRDRQAAGVPAPTEAISTDWPGLKVNRLVAIDEYLKHTLIFRHGQHFSVRQVIKVCANKFGGVHLDVPSGDTVEESALRRLNDEIQLGGAPAVLSVLYAIGRSTAQALRPLREAIR